MKLSAEEQAKLDEVRIALEPSIKAMVEAGHLKAEEATKRLDEAVTALVNDVKSLKDKHSVKDPQGLDIETAKKFSFAKAAYALATKNWGKAGFEHEILEQTAKAQTIDPSTAGGVMVPTMVAQDIIERLQARAVLLQMGASRLNLTGVGKMDFPRQTGSATALWLGELGEITESSLVFDKITLDPKKVAAMVRMSKELIADANQSVEQIVRNDLATQLALAIDLKGLLGDGTLDTPVGILNTAGISTYTATDGTPATYPTFDALIGKLEDENALMGRLGFVSHPTVFRALRQQTVAQYSGQPAAEGQPIFLPILSDARLQEALGYNIGKTTLLPTNGTKGNGTNLTKLIFGNFEDLLFAQWGGLELDASDVAGDNFAKYSVQMRAVARVDWGVRRPKSFAVATDQATSL